MKTRFTPNWLDVFELLNINAERDQRRGDILALRNSWTLLSSLSIYGLDLVQNRIVMSLYPSTFAYGILKCNPHNIVQDLM